MKKFLVLLVIAVVGCTLSSCANGSGSSRSTPTATATTFAYDGEDGRTALELLEEKADQVSVVGDGANAFVTSINGVEAHESKNEFWALSVDGEAATTGAGSLQTETGQTIEWNLETFS